MKSAEPKLGSVGLVCFAVALWLMLPALNVWLANCYGEPILPVIALRK